MTGPNRCPTPRKPTYYDLNLAETISLQAKHNKGYNVEVYSCADHYHIRDISKRNRLDRSRYRKARRTKKKYVQLTIYDWMAQLNGP